MADIWLISDTHFNHEKILEFTRHDTGDLVRGHLWQDVESMNEELIDNWNSVVKPNDLIYHLGDFMLGENKEEWLANNMHRLNGKKHLILGNHDNPKFLAPYFKSIQLWKMFDEAILTHLPMHPSTLQEKNRWKDGISGLNIHGHIHSNPCPKGPYRCVSVEAINFTPVNYELVKA